MKLAVALSVVMLTAGCAGYTVQKDGRGTGYDVYRPDPYLLRTPIADGSSTIRGFEFSLVWLPNYSHRYRVHSWSGFGKADFTFTYTDGWKLTAVEDKSDNTAVLSSLVDLAKHALPAGFAAGGVTATKAEGDVDLIQSSAIPVLYQIMFDEGTECRPGTGAPTGLRQVCDLKCLADARGIVLTSSKKSETPAASAQTGK